MQRVTATFPDGTVHCSNKFNPKMIPDLVSFFIRTYPDAKIKVEECFGSTKK